MEVALKDGSTVTYVLKCVDQFCFVGSTKVVMAGFGPLPIADIRAGGLTWLDVALPVALLGVAFVGPPALCRRKKRKLDQPAKARRLLLTSIEPIPMRQPRCR